MTFLQKSNPEKGRHVSPTFVIPVTGRLNVSLHRRRVIRRGYIAVRKERKGAGTGIIGMMIMIPIAIAIGLLVTSAIVPTSIENMVAVDTTNWTQGTATLFDQIPLIAVIGIFAAIIGSVVVVAMR